MTTPIATYRLQLRNGFTFEDAARLAPYLAELGISHVYLSPIFRAAPGSTHGYDAVDFNEIDPILGGSRGFNALVDELNKHSLKIILDFVPNHMAAHPDNAWWRDVLEWGSQSRYGRHFDIDWSAEKLILPVLGKQYGECLEAGEISIAFDSDRCAFVARYFEVETPLSPATYVEILKLSEDATLETIGQSFAEGGPEKSPLSRSDLARHAAVKRQLIEDALRDVNGDPRKLDEILEAQPWRLAYWRTARDMLTYRRFFEISDLVGVRVEQPDVFADVHRSVLELIRDGKIDGLRIDHIDGLADPRGYLEEIRKMTSGVPDFYLIVEKILGDDEVVRPEWPVEGTTGYEFIRDIGNLFVSDDLRHLNEGYRKFTGVDHDYAAETLDVKRRTLSFNLASELRVLVARASKIAASALATRDFGSDAMRVAIIEIAVHFWIYRTYAVQNNISPTDEDILEKVSQLAKASRRNDDPTAVDFIMTLLSGQGTSASMQAEAAAFQRKFQQMTGPLMAKAIEDTEFYRFNRLIALNEVGGEPGVLRPGIGEFHSMMSRRQRSMPRAMTTTATHDTKRGEDARARLYAIAGFQNEWCESVERWHQILRRSDTNARRQLDQRSEWLFYQALVGAWPTNGTPAPDLSSRMVDFMIKAMRESKRKTSWIDPDHSYENRIERFVRNALEVEGDFISDFGPTIMPLIRAGAALSLVQMIFKIFVPGVPDIYQGTELWDLSLVDPDNRRPVDFDRRQSLLRRGYQVAPFDEAVWLDGSLKLDLLRRSLALRRQIDFTRASYEPLIVDGDDGGNLVAFARRVDNSAIVVIGALISPKRYQRSISFWLDDASWRNAKMQLTCEVRNQYFVDALTGSKVSAKDGSLDVAELLKHLPVAVLSPMRTD